MLAGGGFSGDGASANDLLSVDASQAFGPTITFSGGAADGGGGAVGRPSKAPRADGGAGGAATGSTTLSTGTGTDSTISDSASGGSRRRKLGTRAMPVWGMAGTAGPRSSQAKATAAGNNSFTR